MRSDSDELKDFRYYADKAEEQLIDSQSYVKSEHSFDAVTHKIGVAAVYAELAKAAPKTEATTPVRCPEWLSRDVRDLPRGFIDYQCVLFAGHGVEHESSTGKYWLTEVTK